MTPLSWRSVDQVFICCCNEDAFVSFIKTLKHLKTFKLALAKKVSDWSACEAGIDSLSAVEFRGKISSEFRSVRLPSTLMFDHPTLKATASYIAGQLTSKASGTASVAGTVATVGKLVDEKVRLQKSVALKVQGAACNLPGSREFPEFGRSLWQGTDTITEMPFSRWDADEYYEAAMPMGSTGLLSMYVRHAAFVENVEFFDAQLFSITKVEAEAMDPQQRHLLETAFGAFMDAGFKRSQGPMGLMGKSGGVFVGQDKCDWNRMISAAHAGPFAATGGSASISSNRISYSLGLKGPSATVDTACSSSLVAADTAAMNIREKRCEFAVICGVNMLLLPQTFIGCCQARMLSSDGRCHTFDSSASGYARGEGCGAQVLQDVKMQSLASFLGSALNQDGRSANLTSPNGPSQEMVVRMALQNADCSPENLHQVETHGTGTELGDPIETGALRSVLGHRDQPLRLGAVKTNVGHLEGGAGMAGLSKLVRDPGAICHLPCAMGIRESQLIEKLHVIRETFQDISTHVMFIIFSLKLFFWRFQHLLIRSMVRSHSCARSRATRPISTCGSWINTSPRTLEDVGIVGDHWGCWMEATCSCNSYDQSDVPWLNLKSM